MSILSGKLSAFSGSDPTKRNVILLAVCLALSMSGTSLNMVISALTGKMLADPNATVTLPFLGTLPEASLATLPLSMQFIGTMMATIPASMFMRRVGRRVGFTIGQFIGAGGAALACYAILEGSFWMFTVCGLIIGFHNAFWQYYRFAASETASEAFRPRAISLVMAGGVVAAVVGPTLARESQDLMAPVMFAGSYAVVIVLCLITVVVLQFIRIPNLAPEERRDTGRPMGQIVKQPVFVIAVIAAMLGYAVMSFVMTATPLAMQVCGFDVADTAFVIQWHALGMFAPSFFTGSLIRRFGVLNIIKLGTVLNIACVAVNLSGVDIEEFWLGLLLLGVGWNFMFIGGTTLLTSTYTATERNKVQALNDFIVFGSVSVASLSAGMLQNLVGWDAVNMAIIGPVLVVFLAALWLRFYRPDGARLA
ncbi:MFS transporter [Hwanghaeella sp.]|uniref:MFS transporter n=1 Tax=Hwanghaeella sp. TaxID=2605943 RepID=UPI003CCC26FC